MIEEQALLLRKPKDSLKAARFLADEGFFYAFAISRVNEAIKKSVRFVAKLEK